MTDPMRRMAVLASIGAALVVLVAAGLAARAWDGLDLDLDTRVTAFMVSICAAGLLWLFAVAVVRRGRLPPRTIWIVLIAAVAMRVITLAAPPLLSDHTSPRARPTRARRR